MALNLMALDDMDEREADRPDDRPEDREDETDRAIKTARTYCVEAIDYLVSVMRNQPVTDTRQLDVAAAEVRMKAAIAILEVAGCL